jgi:glycosyltransferase involved in cell wall biosynthesis
MVGLTATQLPEHRIQQGAMFAADTKPLRIAIFTETFLPKVDGIVSVLCLMLRRLQEHGHQVILFGPSGGPQEFAGAEIVGVKGPPLPLYPELRISVPHPRVYQRLKDFKPDLLHVVNPFFLGPFGLWSAQRLRLPVLASFHTDLARYAQAYGVGMLAPLAWLYMRSLHNLADVNLCPSTAVRADLRAHGFKRVRWWKRGIDTEFFTPGPKDMEMRSRLTDGHPEDFLVVNVGRQSPEKGLKDLRDLLFPEPGVRLALVGGGPGHENLVSHFANTPTTLPGYLRGEELVRAYRAADAFIFPSTTETFGLVALEAMACRAPVIAARSGGILDTVEHGVNGLLFDPDQPQQIRRMVRQLRDDPVLREQLAENGLRHAQSRSWRATMDQLVDYYRLSMRVFQRNRRPAAAL